MCGICGYVGDHDPERIDAMSSAMSHRGPDDVGRWHDAAQRVGLGHRRLSILDLSAAGRQPMSNEDGTVRLTFNGEIYNYRELRDMLVAKGHTFRSQTDSEVLVHLYEERGPDMLGELNGMFALGIWDARRRRLFLARDHAGIKPLYYWHDDTRLYFASEIKALLRVPHVPRRLNAAAVPQFLTLLWVPGAETMLEGVKKLEPGHSLTWCDGRVETKRWFSLSYDPDESVALPDWIERVRSTFINVTRRQMVSDVPLGAFLSGGLDSSSIVACMRDAYPDRPITCYTIRQDPGESRHDRFVDDYPYARRVAEHLDVELREFTPRADVTRLLPKVVWHLDEPDADPAAILSYLISRAARDDGTTVLLSGTGGDEVFFGYRSHLAYHRYQQIPRAFRSAAGAACGMLAAAGGPLLGARHPLVRRAARFRRGLARSGVDRHMALVDWSEASTRDDLLLFGDGINDTQNPRLVPDSIRRCYDSFVGAGEITRHSHVLIHSFLAAHNLLYTDKTSMAASVEVRVPFLDVELMRLCARIPERHQLRGGVTKYVLKEAMARYLPHDVLHRSKTGFMAPLRKWVVDDLRDLIGDALSPSAVRARGLFRPAAVERILEDNYRDRADHAYLIYALVTLELWMRSFIDRPGEEVTAG